MQQKNKLSAFIQIRQGLIDAREREQKMEPLSPNIRGEKELAHNIQMIRLYAQIIKLKDMTKEQALDIAPRLSVFNIKTQANLITELISKLAAIIVSHRNPDDPHEQKILNNLASLFILSQSKRGSSTQRQFAQKVIEILMPHVDMIRQAQMKRLYPPRKLCTPRFIEADESYPISLSPQQKTYPRIQLQRLFRGNALSDLLSARNGGAR